ncbi:MAG: DUF2577 family protein [Tenacibaculum sp.]|nr:DUF2577 family protein [Tenacibaculum sp.]
MASNWATDILESTASNKTVDNEIIFAKVKSVSPISVEINGEIIKKFIYETTGFSFNYDESVFDDDILHGKKLLKRWFDFLKKWHKKQKLSVGDVVIVIKREHTFYILAKVR